MQILFHHHHHPLENYTERYTRFWCQSGDKILSYETISKYFLLHNFIFKERLRLDLSKKTARRLKRRRKATRIKRAVVPQLAINIPFFAVVKTYDSGNRIWNRRKRIQEFTSINFTIYYIDFAVITIQIWWTSDTPFIRFQTWRFSALVMPIITLRALL